MLIDCQNVPCGVVECRGWYIMGLVIKAQNDWHHVSGDFKLKCIAITTLLSYYNYYMYYYYYYYQSSDLSYNS